MCVLVCVCVCACVGVCRCEGKQAVFVRGFVGGGGVSVGLMRR